MSTILQQRISDMAKAVVYSHISRGGDSVEDIALAIGMTRKALDHRLQGETPISIQDLKALTNLLEDDRLIQYVCQLCGGQFVRDPHQMGEIRPEASLEHAIRALADASREAGEGISVAAAALANRYCTPEEKVKVEREIIEAQAALSQLQAAVRSMPENPEVRRISLKGTI